MFQFLRIFLCIDPTSYFLFCQIGTLTKTLIEALIELFEYIIVTEFINCCCCKYTSEIGLGTCRMGESKLFTWQALLPS